MGRAIFVVMGQVDGWTAVGDRILNTDCMSGNSQGNSERHREVTGYLLNERVPDQERGAAVLGLVAHAFAYLALVAAPAIWLAVTVRVWRRREEGFATAVRTGVHRPTLAGVRLTAAVGR